jgi:hypothetical protein
VTAYGRQQASNKAAPKEKAGQSRPAIDLDHDDNNAPPAAQAKMKRRDKEKAGLGPLFCSEQ